MTEGVNVEETVRKIVCERLEKKLEEVTLGARIIDDLGASSLDMFDLLTDLEESSRSTLMTKPTRSRPSATP